MELAGEAVQDLCRFLQVKQELPAKILFPMKGCRSAKRTEGLAIGVLSWLAYRHSMRGISDFWDRLQHDPFVGVHSIDWTRGDEK